MPIGDLLAQISGEKSTAGSPSVRTLPRANSIPAKRKPDDDLRADAHKASRSPARPPAPSVLSRPSAAERPSQLQRTSTGNGMRPGFGPASKAPPPPVSRPSKPSRPPSLARPAPNNPPASPTPPKLPPKKGSFAEILARGQRAQAVMGQVGKIQHKKVEKGAAKAKDEGSKPATPPVKGKGPAGYKGTSKPAAHGGANGNSLPRKDARGEPDAARAKASAARRAAAAAAEQEAADKRAKKAAQATTGYTGTARPKPGAAAKKKDVPRGGALLNAPAARHGSSKRSRFEDDYDEDMDDFIEYDDDEGGEDGPRYGYASDGSSDMEAGLEELDVEERRAELLARKEDIEEERLEKSLKAAKEDRKRQALEALRAGKRR